MEQHHSHIAQLNVARMIGKTIDDPVMRDFVQQLDTINSLAEQSEGFVWRLKSDDNNATSFNPYRDDRIIINFSVWTTIETLRLFVYKSAHAPVMKDRKKWFENFGQPYYVLWHTPAGVIPSMEEAINRLAHLQRHGPGPVAFDFRNIYPYSPSTLQL